MTLQLNCSGIAMSGPLSAPIGSLVNMIVTVYPEMAGYTVIFKDGTDPIFQAVTDSNGNATLSWDTTNENLGNHSITAIATPGSCMSSPLIINLFYSSCTISLSVDPISVEQGQMIQISTYTNATPTSNYRILFKDDNSQIADLPLSPDGTTILNYNTSNVTIDSHSITADVFNISTSTIQCTSNQILVTINEPTPRQYPPSIFPILAFSGLILGFIILSEKEKCEEDDKECEEKKRLKDKDQKIKIKR